MGKGSVLLGKKHALWQATRVFEGTKTETTENACCTVTPAISILLIQFNEEIYWITSCGLNMLKECSNILSARKRNTFSTQILHLKQPVLLSPSFDVCIPSGITRLWLNRGHLIVTFSLSVDKSPSLPTNHPNGHHPTTSPNFKGGRNRIHGGQL